MPRRWLVPVLAAGALFAAGDALAAYGWPVKPFDRQHPIRGNLNDPRQTGISLAFHFGIDIAAPDDTPVYAVAPGRVSLHPTYVSVAEGNRIFSYWHIVPTVSHEQRVETGQLLGYIAVGATHVHFAERLNGVWINPLRPGALTPYFDWTSPTITRIQLWRGEKPVFEPLSGTLDLVVDAFDTPPMSARAPWANMPVAPASLRWRVMSGRRTVIKWRRSVNLGLRLLPEWLFPVVYAPGTMQNTVNKPGRYRYYVARGWNTRKLLDGNYRVEVEAIDIRGNAARAGLPVTIANAVAPR